MIVIAHVPPQVTKQKELHALVNARELPILVLVAIRVADLAELADELAFEPGFLPNFTKRSLIVSLAGFDVGGRPDASCIEMS